MIEIKGKCGITAKVILDSISESGVRITTFELVYPRMIHSELMTHRMFSRNAASSRAIPFSKMKEQLTARPVRFGEANSGMQDKQEDFDGLVTYSQDPYTKSTRTPEEAWEDAKNSALNMSEAFYEAGYHKQVYNRLTEPFQMIKTIVTATEFANFFWLRADVAADPSLEELAYCMRQAYLGSVPVMLRFYDWHLPYVDMAFEDIHGTRLVADLVQVFSLDGGIITLEDAIKVSAARCAAVSFRNEDYGLVKCLEVYTRLVGDERKHASALEHQAMPSINLRAQPHTWEKGISHVDRNGNFWSGNLKGWIQYRKLIQGENHVL